MPQALDNRPLIGITVPAYPEYAGRRLRDDYWQRIVEAGGLPLLLPPLPPAYAMQTAGLLDGLLLAGGGDFHPACFGQETRYPPRGAEAARDAFELALIRACWQRGLPLLGICRGMQAMNIALGGSIYQHLTPGENAGIEHDQSAPRQETSHQLRITDQRLAALLGKTAMANSHHHQAVADIAPGFTAGAYAPDNVVEALTAADPARFALGVQWHPECLPQHAPLFAALLSAAADYRRSQCGGVD